jgi:hypothetical protein
MSSPGTTNLLHYWELEEASGTRVDSHGSLNLTDVNTVGVTTGVKGNAASFVGANSESLLSTTPIAFSQGVPLTYNFWVYLASTSQRGIFFEDSSWRNGDDGFAVGVGNTDFDGNGNNLILVQWGIAYRNAGTIGTGWHMITAIVRSDSYVELYLDGSLVYTTPNAIVPFQNWDFTIGSSFGTTVYPLRDGSIDEFAIWNVALSTANLTWLYNSGAGRTYADLSGGGGPTFRPRVVVY